MQPPYGFGHTQEDELTEAAALHLPGGRVLSITSAGEMPLNLLALGAEHVVGVDVLPAQNHLARLKLAAVLTLEREETVRFLGYMPARSRERLDWLDRLWPALPPHTVRFWEEHRDLVRHGPIWAGRFEHYIRLILRFAGPVVSPPFRRMVAAETLEEQRQVFAESLDRPVVHALFRKAFAPKNYGDRGLDARALQHHDDAAEPLGERFFGHLRTLCENVPARSNPYLQLFAVGQVSDVDVVPTYLTAEGYQAVRERSDALEIVDDDVHTVLSERPVGSFDRFHLSNVTDWMPTPDFEGLLELIVERSGRPGHLVWRAIHSSVGVPDALADRIQVDDALGERLRAKDRFPMYAVHPATVR